MTIRIENLHIQPVEVSGEVWFRVVHRPSGQESSLYKLQECADIIGHAVADELMGSFLIGVNDE